MSSAHGIVEPLEQSTEVRETERCLPRQPSVVGGGEALPVINLTGKMLRRQDCRQGHHDEFNIGDGHAIPLRLLLRILQHDDILGDAIRLHVVLVHVGVEGDHVDGVEAPRCWR